MQRGGEILAERYALQPAGRWIGDETPWRTIAEALDASSLFGAGPRIVSVVYRTPEAVRLDHARGLAAQRSGTAVLCAQFWMKKLPLTAPKKALTVRCDRPDANLLARWARKEIGLRGKQIGSDALHTFTRGMENRPLHACLNAIEAITAHAGAEETVERSDVEPFVAPDIQTTAFRICDALAGRRTGEALAVLGDLLSRGEPPLKILGGIGWGFRKAREAHEGMRDGQNRIEVARGLGVRYRPDRYVELADRLGTRGLQRAFQCLLDADAQLKSGRGPKDPRLVLETAVHRLAASSTGP